MTVANDIFSGIAYAHDGTLEGLLSAVFQTYARHETPDDISPHYELAPRLGQYVFTVETNLSEAQRVRAGVERVAGTKVFNHIRTASLLSSPDIGLHINNYIHFLMSLDANRPCSRCTRHMTCIAQNNKRLACPKVKTQLLNDVTHPHIAPIHAACRSVLNEREHMLQFIRFSHLENGVWYAKCNPRDAVIPLIMNHFSARLNTQAFIIYDEVHEMAGVYDGTDWYLVNTRECGSPELNLPAQTANDAIMKDAWQRFYKAVSIDARYNPELRRQFMPVRFWKNLPELDDVLPTAIASR